MNMSAGASDRSHAATCHHILRCSLSTKHLSGGSFSMFSQCKQGPPTHTPIYTHTNKSNNYSPLHTPHSALINACHVQIFWHLLAQLGTRHESCTSQSHISLLGGAIPMCPTCLESLVRYLFRLISSMPLVVRTVDQPWR